MIMRFSHLGIGFIEDRIDTIKIQPIGDDTVRNTAKDRHIM